RTEKEETILYQWSTQGATILVSGQDRLRLAGKFEKVVVGIQCLVTKEIIGVTMKFIAPGLRYSLDVSTGVATLRGIVETGLHNEFLQAVGRWYGDIRCGVSTN